MLVVADSDITSLHLYLWNLGHVSLYGGALLCQFAISGPGMHSYTAAAVRAAVLEPEQELVVKPSEAFQDGYLQWGDEGKSKYMYRRTNPHRPHHCPPQLAFQEGHL